MRKNFRIGPGAASLMLVVVVVALSLLALLSLIEAHGNHKLTSKSVEFSVSEYEAAADAQRSVAELDAILAECRISAENDEAYFADIEASLPEGMTMDGELISWEETVPNGRILCCSVRVNGLDSDERFSWQEHMFMGGAEQFDDQ